MLRLPILTKLGIATGIVVGSSLVLSLGYYPAWIGRQALERRSRVAVHLAEVATHSLVPSGGPKETSALQAGLKPFDDGEVVEFCTILRPKGEVIHRSPRMPPDLAAQLAVQGTRPALLWRERELMIAQAPTSGGGRIIIGLRTADIGQIVRESRWMGLTTSGLLLALGLSLLYLVSRYYVEPLLQLRRSVREVAGGNLDEPPLSPRSDDELGDLAENFNLMTKGLRASREEIERQNRLLEFRVQERTRQLTETIWELEETRAGLEQVVQERTRSLEQSRAELKAWADTLEEKVREKTRELIGLNENLTASFQRLQEVDRLKDEFLANMSHELRTPLNAVIGFSGLLLQESAERIPDDIREDLRIILENGRNLLGMIDSILDISKIEAGKFELDLEPLDPAQTLDEASRLAPGLILDRPIQFYYEPLEVPALILGDPFRLKQVLTNLLGNAIKFTEQGQVGLKAWVEGAQLQIAISDTGIGMDAAGLGRLFKPFQQVDGSITRRFGGTGLGLALSNRLMEMMGGDIRVRSTKGVGSTFTLGFPLCEGGGQP